ncbi:hypothetical protein B0T14DRAFT_565071 [Immersiella caudata]|uniref:Uncharacterized protein n=1 Tax=Immersiella caudata TaxID=314043 RepID=A0AA39WY40_9PEZI|nr:hypothetical protein B0T14DRAFT_565071 [Immersiella caudata]
MASSSTLHPVTSPFLGSLSHLLPFDDVKAYQRACSLMASAYFTSIPSSSRSSSSNITHPSRTILDIHPSFAMCSFEQTIYEGCCKKEGPIQPMAYSCKIWVRCTYGPCRYDKRRDKVFKVISYDMCQTCKDLYRYVNWEGGA